jgi:hypothetical protein
VKPAARSNAAPGEGVATTSSGSLNAFRFERRDLARHVLGAEPPIGRPVARRRLRHWPPACDPLSACGPCRRIRARAPGRPPTLPQDDRRALGQPRA